MEGAKAGYLAIFGGVTTVNEAIAVPSSDASVAATTASGAADAEASNFWSAHGKPLADCIAYKAGQLMLDNFTEETISWIKGGMHGSPNYAIDPKQMEKELLDSVAGNLMRTIDGLEMCDFDALFKNDLKQWVVLGQADPAPVYRAAVACPFPSVNPSDFYRGKIAFTWQYFEKALNDNGNPFGVSVITSSELTKQQSGLLEESRRQLSLNGGFLSVVDDSDPEKCNWPDEATKDAFTSTTATIVTGPDGNPQFIAPASDADKAAMARIWCPKVTPGKLISDQLSKATGASFDRLGLADNLSKIIDAIVTKASNDAIKGIFKK